MVSDKHCHQRPITGGGDKLRYGLTRKRVDPVGREGGRVSHRAERVGKCTRAKMGSKMRGCMYNEQSSTQRRVESGGKGNLIQVDQS